MTHDLFGKLKYKDADECWVAQAKLGRFAGHGARALEQPMTEEQTQQIITEMNQALDNMRGLMREKFGESADAVFAEIDKEVDAETAAEFEKADEPDPAEAERERKRLVRAAKKADRLARGLFPVRIADPDEVGPTPQQEAAFRDLTENEPAVLDAVLAEVWDSFSNAYGQEYWRKIASLKPAASIDELRGRFALTRVEITREHRGGFSHLVFSVDSDWQDEHGLMVVYSPDTREASWTSYDGLDELTESDEPTREGEEYVPTSHDELVEAVLMGDEDRARELIAAGADINALGPDEYPPLCIAVDQMEAEEVRRLLAFGADPNLIDPDEKKTPLKLAKRMYRDMGFGPTKKKDALLDAMMTLARDVAGKQFEEIRTKLEEIIRLLEAAGGK